MSRYINDIPTGSLDLNPVLNQVQSYLTSEGFKIKEYKGQQVWKKGSGFLTAPQYIAVTCAADHVRVEAFLRMPILPGIYAGETGIDGFYGAIPKQMLAGRAHHVENLIISYVQQASIAEPIRN